jgi:PAS domain S-box-containing protein
MDAPLKILMLEDNPFDAEIIQRLLLKEKINCDFLLVMNKEKFLIALDQFSPGLILSDHSLPDFNSLEALHTAKQKLPHTAFIMVTGAVSEEFAANIIKEGADDYILKDRLQRLPAAIRIALEQKRAAKELTDYKYALDQSAIVSMTDHAGIIIYANENFRGISGYSEAELIGKDHRIVNSGYHPESYIKSLWKTIASGKIWKGEFCNQAKDGTLYWVDSTIVPFLDHKNKPYQYLSIRLDITQKKRAEEALKVNELRLIEAQSIAHIGSWEIDLVNNTQSWSDELYQILALNKDDIKPTVDLFLSFVREEERDLARRIISDAFANFNNSSINFHLTDNNGRAKYASIKWRFEFDKNGSPTRQYGILQDITERKESEKNLKVLEQKILHQSIQEQKKIARAIIDGQEKERNYIGQELHDNINQILAGAKLYLSLAAKKSEEIKSLIDLPIQLINTSIDEIRLLSQKLVTPVKSIYLEALVKDLLNTLKQTCQLKTSLHFELPADTISTDIKLSIYRIIQEQINNIQKYAEAKKVNVSITLVDNNIQITTRDDGRGFNLKSKRKGVGISNIINRVESYNGKVQIETDPGKGCSFHISIPANSK